MLHTIASPTRTPFRLSATITLALAAMLCGCQSTPAPQAAPGSSKTSAATTQPYPPRPTAPPATFKIFHHDDTSFTLVAKEDATDAEIESLLWQLHDAAHTHSFDALHIPQKIVDARAPIVWFHIYRGTKCAPEKYAPGEPPCGGSYHAAGDYTYGGYANRERDNGVLHQFGGHDLQLWNPDVSKT